MATVINDFYRVPRRYRLVPNFLAPA